MNLNLKFHGGMSNLQILPTFSDHPPLQDFEFEILSIKLQVQILRGKGSFLNSTDIIILKPYAYLHHNDHCHESSPTHNTPPPPLTPTECYHTPLLPIHYHHYCSYCNILIFKYDHPNNGNLNWWDWNSCQFKTCHFLNSKNFANSSSKRSLGLSQIR